jgi:hypothetical protein
LAVVIAGKDNNQFPKLLLILLPATHLALWTITAILGKKAATGGNPLVCVDLPVSLLLFAQDSWPRLFFVGVLGTIWWYFIARIGWSSKQHRISRLGAGLGAILILFVCVADSALMISEFYCCISHEPNFLVLDGVIYVFAVALLSGSLMSAIYSATTALGFNRS